MPSPGGKGKRKRTHKISHGVHGGGGKTSLTRLQLALLGKGPTAALAVKMQKANRGK